MCVEETGPLQPQKLIDDSLQISVSKQAKLLKVSRGCYYYRPKPVSSSDLKLMRCIDELHMQYPFAGSRMMRDLLNRQGHHKLTKTTKHAKRHFWLNDVCTCHGLLPSHSA